MTLSALQRIVTAVTGIMLSVLCLMLFSGCGGSASAEETSGAAFESSDTIIDAMFLPENARGSASASIDISHTSDGYVGAQAQSGSRLKFQVIKEGTSYNYDLPGDGTPIIVPLNMGNGSYTFAIMQNTSGNKYVEVYSTSAEVELVSEFEPYIRPNLYCNYHQDSAVVAKAHELTQDANNQADALKAVYEWILNNVEYDDVKAEELSGTSGYVPNPDETLQSGKGICFDYASLAAAMLRSQGIPCKVVTGYVAPDGVYHAWNMVWIDGTWRAVSFTVDAQTWSRIDITLDDSGASDTVGDGSNYEDRYTY